MAGARSGERKETPTLKKNVSECKDEDFQYQ
jgi:hypothetical protein